MKTRLAEGNQMTTLSPELRQEIEKAGLNPVRLEDPDTHAAYVL